MAIDAHTRPVGLLGYPVEHSLSPLIHNTAFRRLQLNYVYVALPVAPSDLGAAVKGLRVLGFTGSNVTIPHKQGVMPLVDELSVQARAVGAVNTLVFRRLEDERITVYGENTDVVGFLDPLASYAERLHGAPMAVLGAGGAARAVVYALLSTFRPARLTVVARTVERAERLTHDLASYDERSALEVVHMDDAAQAIRSSVLIVNATPLGMSPAVEVSPWPAADDFSSGQIVYDLVYNPSETRLLREAAVRGASTIGGLDMLICQAAASFTEWTGKPMPVEAVKAAVLAYF